MLKRTPLLIGALVALAIGLLVWPAAWADEEDSKEIEVIWSIEGCQLDLDPSNTIDLGTLSPEQIATSSPFPLTIDSNCEYIVRISWDAANAPSGVSDDDLSGRYEFRTESVAPSGEINNLNPSFISWSVGDTKDVCESDNSPPFTGHVCNIQFRVDTDLLPVGSYTMEHTVTLSTP